MLEAIAISTVSVPSWTDPIAFPVDKTYIQRENMHRTWMLYEYLDLHKACWGNGKCILVIIFAYYHSII